MDEARFEVVVDALEVVDAVLLVVESDEETEVDVDSEDVVVETDEVLWDLDVVSDEDESACVVVCTNASDFDQMKDASEKLMPTLVISLDVVDVGSTLEVVVVVV